MWWATHVHTTKTGEALLYSTCTVALVYRVETLNLLGGTFDVEAIPSLVRSQPCAVLTLNGLPVNLIIDSALVIVTRLWI